MIILIVLDAMMTMMVSYVFVAGIENSNFHWKGMMERRFYEEVATEVMIQQQY
jgi:hypothetical protein